MQLPIKLFSRVAALEIPRKLTQNISFYSGGGCKTQNFNGTGLDQGELPEKFKENNLAKVNYLKLQTQEKHSRMFSLAFSLPKTMSNFYPSKLRQKKVSKNNEHIQTRQIPLKKVRENNVNFSTIEFTSKKVRGSNLDFLTIKITSRKVRGNNVDFSNNQLH